MPKITTKNRLISRRVDIVETTLDDIIFTAKQGFDEMGVRFDEIDRKFYRVDNRLGIMDNEIVSIGDTLARLMTKMESESAAFLSRFDRNDERFDSMDRQFERLDKQLININQHLDKWFEAQNQKLSIT